MLAPHSVWHTVLPPSDLPKWLGLRDLGLPGGILRKLLGGPRAHLLCILRSSDRSHGGISPCTKSIEYTKKHLATDLSGPSVSGSHHRRSHSCRPCRRISSTHRFQAQKSAQLCARNGLVHSGIFASRISAASDENDCLRGTETCAHETRVQTSDPKVARSFGNAAAPFSKRLASRIYG